MNKMKIMILAILFVGVVGLALSNVSAADNTYKTGKIYFKYNGDKKYPSSEFSKNLDKKTEVFGFYNYPRNINSQHPANFMQIGIDGKMTKSYSQYKPSFKPSKITVFFKKTSNGKTSYSSKSFTKFSPNEGYGYSISYSPKNNFQPNYAIVYYKKI